MIAKLLGVLPQYNGIGAGFALVHDALDYFIRNGYRSTIASRPAENLSAAYVRGLPPESPARPARRPANALYVGVKDDGGAPAPWVRR